jgi:hypothetical protein
MVPSPTKWLAVVKFQPVPTPAASTLVIHESAPISIALRDGALDRGWDVA